MELELKGKFKDASISTISNKITLSFEVDEQSTENLNELIANKKDLRINIVEWREKRSLNANAYFHVLVNKIAKTLNSSMQEIKQRLVFDYGTFETNENGVKLGFEAREDIPISNLFEYAKEIGKIEKNGKTFKRYIIYKRTHTLNSEEMANLIDGAVQEAKDLNIQTLTPNELARLKAVWEAQQ